MSNQSLLFNVIARTDQLQESLGQMNSAINASMSNMKAQVEQASKGTESASQKMAKGIGDTSKEVAKSFDEAGIKASGAAQIIGSSLSAIPNPYAQAAGSLIAVTDGVKNSLLQLEQAAQKSHMGTVQFIELKDALQAAGVPTEHLPEQLSTLSEAISQAAQHSGTARSAFQQLGISTSSWKSKIPSTSEVLLQLAERMKNGALSGRGMEAAQRLLGESSGQLIGFLQQGSTAVRAQMNAHKENAVAMNHAMASASALQQQEGALSELLQTRLLPVFEAIVVAISMIVRGAITEVDAFESGVLIVIQSFQTLGRAAKDVVHGNWAALGDDLKNYNMKIVADVQATVSKIENTWSGFGTQFKNLFADLPEKAGESNNRVTGSVSEGTRKRAAIIELGIQKSVIDHKAADEQIVSDAQTILGQLPGVEQGVHSRMLGILTQYASSEKVVYAKTTADIERGESQSLARRRQQWSQFFQTVNSAFSGFAKSLMSGHQTLSQAWAKTVDDMASKFLSGLEKQLTAYLQQQFAEVAINTQAEETKDAVSEAQHAKENGRTASSAAGHAYDAVVDTPIVGPVLAPIAAATAFAAVSAFGSAAGGQWEVPGLQMTMLHPQEMVLPAGLASRMRDVVEGRASGGGGGVTVVINHSVNAVDAESFQGVIRKHGNMIGNEVARVLKKKGFAVS